jgi:Sulfotransferase domain
MRNPDFFIIGAPKCGTTSLATWLASHPQILMPRIKEPHFFSCDLDNGSIRSWRAYRRLFRDATERHLAVGEASTSYLYSHEAVPAIERALPGARYIVLLRNPVDMAYSLHQHQIVAGVEHITDFHRAWELCDKRYAGRHTIPLCREPKLLAYDRVCRIGEQLARLFSLVPAERVLALFLGDLAQNPLAEYGKVLSFLGLANDERSGFPVENAARVLRSPAMNYLTRAAAITRQRLGIPWLGGVGRTIVGWNSKIQPRRRLPEDYRQELTNYFCQDVAEVVRFLPQLESYRNMYGREFRQ